MSDIKITTENGIPETTVEQVYAHKNSWRLIDVRRPEEFNNELGHIQNSELITMGPQLAEVLESGNRDEKIIFVCRSGARSGQVTAYAVQLGYKNVLNMMGGMIRWNEMKFPIEKNENG